MTKKAEMVLRAIVVLIHVCVSLAASTYFGSKHGIVGYFIGALIGFVVSWQVGVVVFKLRRGAGGKS